MPDYSLAELIVDYRCHGHSSASTTVTIRTKLTDTVKDFLFHLQKSLGLTSTLGTKCLTLDGQYFDSAKQLKDCGIQNGSLLTLQGYKPLKRLMHTVRVKYPNGDLYLKVINTMTLLNLKHKLQDETGIPISEQILVNRNGRTVTGDIKSTEMFKNGLTLKWRHATDKLQLDNVDGPLHSCQSSELLPPSSPRKPIRKHSARSSKSVSVPHSHLREETNVATDKRSTTRDKLLSKVPDVLISDCDLLKICAVIPEIDSLTRLLGISEARKVSLTRDNRDDYEELKYQTLLQWKRNTINANLKQLVVAILADRNDELALKVIEMFK